MKKIEGINLTNTIKDAESLISDSNVDIKSLTTMLTLLLTLLKILINQLGLDSSNSSKPPSSDDLKKKKKKPKPKGKKKSRGGQNGHKGTTLTPVETPDHVKDILIDRSTLPKGNYTESGFESRQVVEVIMTSAITEWRAQVLVDQHGKRFVATFPKGITRPIQYGSSVKGNSVYLSQFQLIPIARVQAQFSDQYAISLSTGSISNFNQEAYERLEFFEKVAKDELCKAAQAHADETGINVDGKRIWLHSMSTSLWTFFAPHSKRGCEAMNAIGIIPSFSGVLCHDHWKPYYKYECTHALCNAHHLRELTCAHEQDEQKWAKDMGVLLVKMKNAVDKAGGALSESSYWRWRKKYRDLIRKAELECPPPKETFPKKRGRLKRSKSRNLLERLRDYEQDVLRFIQNEDVPFTNNQGERDIRMTKVQQKISGCFRSIEGAKVFCRVRSYISTCKKNDISAATALDLLFKGQFPKFIQDKIDDLTTVAE